MESYLDCSLSEPEQIVRCIHCGKEIRTKEEHGEKCPENILDGKYSLSHGITPSDHIKLTGRTKGVELAEKLQKFNKCT